MQVFTVTNNIVSGTEDDLVTGQEVPLFVLKVNGDDPVAVLADLAGQMHGDNLPFSHGDTVSVDVSWWKDYVQEVRYNLR